MRASPTAPPPPPRATAASRALPLTPPSSLPPEEPVRGSQRYKNFINPPEPEQCEEEEARTTPGPTKAHAPLIPASSAHVPPPSPPCPRERLKGMLKEIKPRQRTNHREDPRGCLLNLLLQSQSPSLKRPLQRRERRYPKGKREKLTLARREIILQKTEMPKQTRHRKLKVLEMPSEVCAFLITVYFW
ncbi:LOW QUALITY PROTEIN: putative Dresden prostate carcinoma protein 2 [Microcebus murinus]|uniref:LOW QUALITY PROTEIN: putative Dresden prostate carcinoma protein 2 n=1 Tax=Microcebus murinus TaxID=30608 RepID=UPI003F6BBF8D